MTAPKRKRTSMLYSKVIQAATCLVLHPAVAAFCPLQHQRQLPPPLRSQIDDETTAVVVDNSSSLKGLYMTIAQHDPLWLEDFVINTLKEKLDDELLAIMECAKQRTSSTPATTETPSSNAALLLPTQFDCDEHLFPHQKSPAAVVVAPVENNTAKPCFETKPTEPSRLDRRDAARLAREAAVALRKESEHRAHVAQEQQQRQENEALLAELAQLAATQKREAVEAQQKLVETTQDSPKQRQETRGVEKPRQGEEKAVVVVAQLAENFNRRHDENTHDDPVSNSTVNVESVESSRIVLYQVSSSGTWRTQPLSKLATLGYTLEEIASMDPDALSLIVQEGLSRPRSGIPSRWKAVTAKDQVRITSEAGVRQFLSNEEHLLKTISPPERSGDDGQRRSRRQSSSRVQEENGPTAQNIEVEQQPPTASTNSYRSNTTAVLPMPQDQDERREGRNKEMFREQRRRDREQQPPTASTNSSRSNATAAPPMPQDQNERREGKNKESFREQRRRDRVSSERADQVYNGRSRETRRREDDPPPPKSNFWPDIDAFRSMLRDEAGFRLRLLGDDWASVVKDESEWRLGLYKNWLWTLHNGVGPPIVDSRVDRMRRRREQQRQVSKNPSNNNNVDDSVSRRPRNKRDDL
jgi:hypothetical protein